MKKLLATIAIALMALAPAKAETMQEKVERCTGLSDLVGSIASAHQSGVELSKMLGEETLAPYSGLIIAIHSENTRYSSESFREEVVTDTKNRAMLICLKDG